MAETKPTKVPRWNEGGSNRTEPPETGSKSKTTGWAVDDEPPSSYFNWLQYYTGAFLKWIDERMFDGGAARDFTISSVAGTSGQDGGELLLKAEDGNTNALGGIVRINTGDGGSTFGGGGAFILQCGSAPTDGWGGAIIMGAGDAVGSYNGGNVTIESGDSASGQGGNFTISSGDGDNAGTMNVLGGDGIGAADGGNIIILAGAAGATSGFGGDISITGGSGRQLEGGDINVTAGSCIQTSGGGGDITLTGGAGIDGEGGDINLTAGDCGSGTGGGGDITLTAGDGIDSEGGNINLLSGDATGTTGDTGGDLVMRAGDAAGTNKAGGEAELAAGRGTGNVGSLVSLRASEPGASGTGQNSLVNYLRCYGDQTNVESYVHHKFDQSQSGKGSIELVPRSEPTSPPDGDMYYDNATDQLNVYNGTRYHGLNSHVYALKQYGYSIVSAGSTFPYYEHYLENDGSTKVAYQIPAYSLRVGTVLRFDVAVNYTPSGNRTPRTYIGIDTSFMSSPSYSLPALYFYINSGSGSAYYYNAVYCRIIGVVRAIGASGAIWFNHTSNFVHNFGTVTPTSWNDFGYADVPTVNTNADFYIFPFVRFNDIGSVGDYARCDQFSLELS